ncbi:recombinase family protein [Salmonella enterica subsp. enterica serovar Ibadan]|nr:recombinase family protein [Salmonella enterica subsp. enterica serovar Ibadan]ECF3282135.1 recombinase family protein [Salmonella enterica subsp. enterica serovar Ibadan]
MFVAYCRVSTSEDQTVANQIHALKSAGYSFPVAIVDEGVSGTKPLSKREGFQRLLKLVKPGDTVLITAQDRIGRNRETFNEIKGLLDRGVQIVSLREAELRAVTADQRFMLAIRCEVAIYERDLIAERTRQALQRVKSEGKVLGGHITEKGAQARTMLAEGYSVPDVMKATGIGRAMAYRIKQGM